MEDKKRAVAEELLRAWAEKERAQKSLDRAIAENQNARSCLDGAEAAAARAGVSGIFMWRNEYYEIGKKAEVKRIEVEVFGEPVEVEVFGEPRRQSHEDG